MSPQHRQTFKPPHAILLFHYYLLPTMHSSILSLSLFLLAGSALASPTQRPISVGSENTGSKEKFDLSPIATYAFSGITTFSQLPSKSCLTDSGPSDDILVVGFPFDTATSYRSGTRFGPNAIRQGSRAPSLA